MHPNILFFGITALTFHTANAVAILPRSTTEIPSFTFSNSTTNSTSDENLPSPKPILVAEICSSVACETVKTVENDCRMLTTVLGPTVGKVVVYNPATCVFSATSNCSKYGDIDAPLNAVFVKSGAVEGESVTVEDVQVGMKSKVMSMVCFRTPGL